VAAGVTSFWTSPDFLARAAVRRERGAEQLRAQAQELGAVAVVEGQLLSVSPRPLAATKKARAAAPGRRPSARCWPSPRRPAPPGVRRVHGAVPRACRAVWPTSYLPACSVSPSRTYVTDHVGEHFPSARTTLRVVSN
jgi:hypothetical protein